VRGSAGLSVDRGRWGVARRHQRPQGWGRRRVPREPPARPGRRGRSAGVTERSN